MGHTCAVAIMCCDFSVRGGIEVVGGRRRVRLAMNAKPNPHALARFRLAFSWQAGQMT